MSYPTPPQNPTEVVGLACELIGVGSPEVCFNERIAGVLEEHLDGLSSLNLQREALHDLRSVYRGLMLERRADIASSLTSFIFTYAARIGMEKQRAERMSKHREDDIVQFVKSREEPAPAKTVKPWLIQTHGSDDTDN